MTAPYHQIMSFLKTSSFHQMLLKIEDIGNFIIQNTEIEERALDTKN